MEVNNSTHETSTTPPLLGSFLECLPNVEELTVNGAAIYKRHEFTSVATAVQSMNNLILLRLGLWDCEHYNSSQEDLFKEGNKWAQLLDEGEFESENPTMIIDELRFSNKNKLERCLLWGWNFVGSELAELKRTNEVRKNIFMPFGRRPVAPV